MWIIHEGCLRNPSLSLLETSNSHKDSFVKTYPGGMTLTTGFPNLILPREVKIKDISKYSKLFFLLFFIPASSLSSPIPTDCEKYLVIQEEGKNFFWIFKLRHLTEFQTANRSLCNSKSLSTIYEVLGFDG